MFIMYLVVGTITALIEYKKFRYHEGLEFIALFLLYAFVWPLYLFGAMVKIINRYLED